MWQVMTVKKSELAEYLADGWEPIGCSMVPSKDFIGVPVIREYWHLRRFVPLAS